MIDINIDYDHKSKGWAVYAGQYKKFTRRSLRAAILRAIQYKGELMRGGGQVNAVVHSEAAQLILELEEWERQLKARKAAHQD